MTDIKIHCLAVLCWVELPQDICPVCCDTWFNTKQTGAQGARTHLHLQQLRLHVRTLLLQGSSISRQGLLLRSSSCLVGLHSSSSGCQLCGPALQALLLPRAGRLLSCQCLVAL
jgi:hypothetical protein